MNTIAWITSKNEQYDIKDIEARKTKLNIEDLPKNLSAFSNDMGFIDNTVNNLINYYKKSETYTKTEIDQKLSAKWDSKFVDELPTEDISTTTIYFLKRKKEQGTTQYESDVYDEYIYSGTWELIGNTYVDLTDYYRKSEVEEVIDNKVLVETNNRILSENEIKNNIENVNNYAKSIENNLNSEISTRQNNDLVHDTKINEVENNLNSEISRATNAENTLSSRCDTYDSHIANIDNPHSVTAEQIGLGNVTNVSTTDTITLNSENNITSGAVYTALENKVDKIDGRGLSEQNFTLTEKTKLAGLKNYDDTSISNRVTATENAITTLNGNSSVSGSVDKKIADAIAGVTQIDFKIVSSLPSTGIKGTIYLIRGTGTETTQQYDEYIWVDSKWEQLGKSTIEVNLSDIYSKSEVNALVSVKNDKITITDDSSTALTDADTFSTTSNSGTNPTNLTKRPMNLLWNYIKSKISSVLGLTKDNYGGKASTATSAEGVNKIVPNYTTKALTTVTSLTTKYIKVADCTWYQTGTLQVHLFGDAFEDTLVINFGGGNSTKLTLCGHYSSNANRVLSVIAKKGTVWNSNYLIYLKIYQRTTCTVQVALLRGSCTIDITESTTAPTNISEWAVRDGFFGTFTGNVTSSDVNDITFEIV